MALYIYGEIGSWWDGLDAESVRRAIEDHEAEETIEVFINSQGGDVFAAYAIMSMLRRHKGSVTAHIDGLAASAATLVMMAGDEIVMPSNAMLMIHNPWMLAVGDYRDMKKAGESLEKVRDSMITEYRSKTGKTEEELREMLDDETWLTADEAAAHGFVDRVSENIVSATLSQRLGTIDFRKFKQAPDDFAAVARIGKRKIAAMAATQRGADMGMQDNGKEPASAPRAQDKPEEPAIDVTAEINAAKMQALSESRERLAQISALCEKVGLSGSVALDIAAKAESVDEAQGMIIDAVASRSEVQEVTNANPTATVGTDARDKFKAAAVDAVLMRAGVIPQDGKNDLRRFSLERMAEESIVQAGGRPDGDGRTMVKQALNIRSLGGHSTSDFPSIMEDVMHKRLLSGYEEMEETWSKWCRTGSLTDFREVSLMSLTIFDDLKEVAENGEYTHGSIEDRGEKIQLAKYGKIIPLSYEMIINDDLRALTVIPAKMGRAAARVPGDLVYGILTGNSTMSEDNTALFHGNHNNTTADTLSADTLVAMRTAMRTQAIKGRALGIMPRFLLVPVALEGDAIQILEAQYESEQLDPNRVRKAFEVVGEPRLDMNSVTEFYLAADGNSQDTVEVAFRDGNSAPVLEQKEGWDVDAIEYKVRLECAAAPVDFRGLQRGGA